MLAGAALAARVLFVALEAPVPPVADERTWVDSARIVSDARVGFSPLRNSLIFHPPLYTYFLGAADALLGLEGARWLQAVLTVLLVPAVGRVAGFAFGPRAGTWAAGAAAFYPELVWFSGHFWVENVFMLALWWAFERAVTADRTGRLAPALVGGVLWGLSVLARETTLYFAPVAAAWLAWRPREARGWARAGAFLATALLTVAPWTWRNWVVFRAFVPVSTAAGQNLFQGNTHLPRDETYVLVDAVQGRVQQYRYARAMGLAAIRERQPAWILEKLRDQMPMFWEAESMALIHLRRGAYGPVPASRARLAAVVMLAPYLATLALFVVGVGKAPPTRLVALLLVFLAYYNLLHIVAHGFNRYRLPVMPVVFAFAAHGLLAGRVPWTRARAWGAAALGLVMAASVVPSLRRQAREEVYREAPPVSSRP
jgi:hypothetical protein